jgi:hypothetical protein
VLSGRTCNYCTGKKGGEAIWGLGEQRTERPAGELWAHLSFAGAFGGLARSDSNRSTEPLRFNRTEDATGRVFPAEASVEA